VIEDDNIKHFSAEEDKILPEELQWEKGYKARNMSRNFSTEACLCLL